MDVWFLVLTAFLFGGVMGLIVAALCNAAGRTRETEELMEALRDVKCIPKE